MDIHELTQAELADILNCTDRALRDWGVEDPPIPSIGFHRKRRYDLSLVVPWLVARAVRQAGISGRSASDKRAIPDENTSQCRKLAAEADLAELKLSKERSELIHVRDYEHAWATRIQRHREGMASIKSRLQVRVGAEVAEIVDVEIRRVLGDMASIVVQEGA